MQPKQGISRAGGYQWLGHTCHNYASQISTSESLALPIWAGSECCSIWHREGSQLSEVLCVSKALLWPGGDARGGRTQLCNWQGWLRANRMGTCAQVWRARYQIQKYGKAGDKMSTNSGCLFWHVLKIQNLKTADRDGTVWLVLFRTCSNAVKASTKTIMLDRKHWGPDLAPQVSKLPKANDTSASSWKLQLIPPLVIFTAKYVEVRNKLTPTLCSPFVNLCWQVQSHWGNSANPGWTFGVVSGIAGGQAWLVTQGLWWGTAGSVSISPHTSQLSPGTQHSSPRCSAKD